MLAFLINTNNSTEMAETFIHTHHVLPNGHGGWYVRRDDSDELCANTSTKMAAVCIGRELSSNEGSVLFIHEQMGRILRHTESGIPFPYPFGHNWLGAARLGESVRAQDTSEDSAPLFGDEV